MKKKNGFLTTRLLSLLHQNESLLRFLAEKVQNAMGKFSKHSQLIRYMHEIIKNGLKKQIKSMWLNGNVSYFLCFVFFAFFIACSCENNKISMVNDAVILKLFQSTLSNSLMLKLETRHALDHDSSSFLREILVSSNSIRLMCLSIIHKTLLCFHILIIQYERCHKKTCLWRFRPGPIQTRLYNHRRWLEACTF